MKTKSKKKSLVVLLLACLLVFATVLGTVAWLTATDVKVNTFTVGDIDQPEVGPTDPDNPDLDDPVNPYDPDEDDNIYEPGWPDDVTPELVPGNVITKDPYVGIGAGSEPAYAYLYVDNAFGDLVYFEINEGWEAVDSKHTALVMSGKTYYIGGLFKYTEVLNPDADGDGSAEEAWSTTPLFSEVIVAEEATHDTLNAATDKTITLKAYLHQAFDGEGNSLEATADAAAKAFDWSTLTE